LIPFAGFYNHVNSMALGTCLTMFLSISLVAQLAYEEADDAGVNLNMGKEVFFCFTVTGSVPATLDTV